MNNFDWALAHMTVAKSKTQTAKRRKSSSQGEIDEVYEAEMSQNGDDVDSVQARLLMRWPSADDLYCRT